MERLEAAAAAAAAGVTAPSISVAGRALFALFLLFNCSVVASQWLVIMSGAAVCGGEHRRRRQRAELQRRKARAGWRSSSACGAGDRE